MLPIAIFVGRNADRLGRRPIFLIAFSVLPIRAALYTLSNNALWLIGVQLLDGVGAGIYQALTPLVIADIMRGTGRYNLAQGAVATTQGIGAAISAVAAGEVMDHFGYNVSFLALGAAAVVAYVAFLVWMPETRELGPNSRVNAAAACDGASSE
jgi:MFS family permease